MGAQSVWEKSRTQQVRPGVSVSGGKVIQRDTINFIPVGGTITAVDNPSTGRVDVSVTSGPATPVLDKLTTGDVLSDFVVTGLQSPTSASLISILAAGVAYVTGLRTVVGATSFTYTASQDTYDDLASTGVITHVAVANGAAAPAITANNLRLQKVVSSGTAITAVTNLAASATLTLPGGTIAGLASLGVGVTTPSALLHIAAGTATAGTAPQKFNAGALLTAPEVGAEESDASAIRYYTDGAATRRRYQTTNYTGSIAGLPIIGSPYIYINTSGYDMDVLITGGTVSLIEFSRGGIVYFPAGITSGSQRLSPLDRVRVTYSAVPSARIIPR